MVIQPVVLFVFALPEDGLGSEQSCRVKLVAPVRGPHRVGCMVAVGFTGCCSNAAWWFGAHGYLMAPVLSPRSAVYLFPLSESGENGSPFLSCRFVKNIAFTPVQKGGRQGHGPELRLRSALPGGSWVGFALLLCPFLSTMQQAIKVSEDTVMRIEVGAPAAQGKAAHPFVTMLGILKAGCRTSYLYQKGEDHCSCKEREGLFGLCVDE